MRWRLGTNGVKRVELGIEHRKTDRAARYIENACQLSIALVGYLCCYPSRLKLILFNICSGGN